MRCCSDLVRICYAKARNIALCKSIDESVSLRSRGGRSVCGTHASPKKTLSDPDVCRAVRIPHASYDTLARQLGGQGAALRHTCTTARSSTDTELLDPPDFEKQIDFADCIAWQSSGATRN